jgi:hypothetical protein
MPDLFPNNLLPALNMDMDKNGGWKITSNFEMQK